MLDYYHLKQWEYPLELTVETEKVFANNLMKSKSVIDLGCGAGGATHFFACKYPDLKFLGLDNDCELIRYANSKNNQENCSFDFFDIYTSPLENHEEAISGLISLATLSWLRDFKFPIKRLVNIFKPEWIGITSLFYDGNISSYATIYEHSTSRVMSYNTYSLTQVRSYLNSLGYDLTQCIPFDIQFDLQRSENRNMMGTYTVRTDSESTSRVQISGPQLMSWYILLAERIH